MLKYIVVFLSIIGLLTSCFKEDQKVLPHEPGDVTTVTIPLTQYYTYQMYFEFERGEIVSDNNRSIFDLQFDCHDTATNIYLNTANFAMAAKTQFMQMEDVTDTVGLSWYYDKSDGDKDSLAINNWINIQEGDTTIPANVYVINRGVSALGIPLGLKKIQFYDYKDNKYFFRYSNMDDSGLVESFIIKEEGHSKTQFYMLEGGEAIQTEPLTNEWDLLFTQYTTLLYTDEGDPYPYLVTGTLQNMEKVEVAMDSTMIFSEISLSDTSLFEFSSQQDKIGYDWKDIVGDVETGDFYYETMINYNYIVRDRNLFYYKLRFVNFYDPVSGEKGYPVFEYQRL